MMESEVRNRKKSARPPSYCADTNPAPSTLTPSLPRLPEDVLNGTRNLVGVADAMTVERHWSGLPAAVGLVSKGFGVIMLVAASVIHTAYMISIHENDLWFSNIKEMEREISFRTESGLYYSYYKQLIQAPSLIEGVHALMIDNLTEHGRTINVLARMNIYQEVMLAATYRTFPLLQRLFEPIFFYTNAIFALHGLLVGALYGMTWLLSGSWLAGLLTAAFYIFNKEDTTRVSFVIPLRESFALPFLWGQLAFITVYFKPHSHHRGTQWLLLVSTGVCTFFFSVTWQFNQFVLLLQAMALFAVQVLGFVPLHKVRAIYLLQLGSLLAVSLVQFGNTMILSGPCISFISAALIIMFIQRRMRPEGVIRSAMTVVGYIILVFFLMAVFNLTAKVLTREEADEHIGKFVLTKFGFYGDQPQLDFDVRLYLCNAAFAFIGQDVFERMTRTLVFPIYAYVHAIMVAILVIAFLQRTSTVRSDIPEDPDEEDHFFKGRPDLAYHIIQTVFFGVLAVSTLRMKYLWTPYMCVLAAVGVSDKAVTTWLLERCSITSTKALSVRPSIYLTRHWDQAGLVEFVFLTCALIVAAVRHFLTIAIFLCFLHLVLPKALKDLDDLREFYDPDTLELMNWIKQHTPQTAAFAGSMQLLAGVKLCTGRPITNHPHYEDKHLRQRTKELYQMYGRRLPHEVHQILLKYDVTYIILEDSLCMGPSRGNCRLPDMIDIDNGIIPDNGAPLTNLVKSKVPRFCDRIRHGSAKYTKYFKMAFTNKTFRIYQVLRHNTEGKNNTNGTPPPNSAG